MTRSRTGMVALLGLAALVFPASPVRVHAPNEAAALKPCPKAGTYTADVDGAPGGGLCRQSIGGMAPVAFNIPPGKLFDGLKAFLEQSGARGWVPLDIMMANICTAGTTNCTKGPIPTAGVSGTMAPRAALEQLLQGTGVSYVQDQTGTIRFPASADAPAPGARCLWQKEPPNACPGS